MYLGAAVAVIALLVGAGIYYYPQYRQAQVIKEIVREDSRGIARIVENARKLSTAQIYVESYAPEIAQISEMSTQVEKILMGAPGNIPLSSLLTRLKFLDFERKFAGLFDKREFDAAAKLVSTLTADLSTIASKIPSDSSNSDIRDVLVTVQLAKYADILLKFRALASEFPDVSVNAPRKPSVSRLLALQKLKTRSVNIRRESNRILSATYIVFKKIVDDVDSHDIGLINAWSQLLKL
jgi:hypothetical protein